MIKKKVKLWREISESDIRKQMKDLTECLRQLQTLSGTLDIRISQFKYIEDAGESIEKFEDRRDEVSRDYEQVGADLADFAIEAEAILKELDNTASVLADRVDVQIEDLDWLVPGAQKRGWG